MAASMVIPQVQQAYSSACSGSPTDYPSPIIGMCFDRPCFLGCGSQVGLANF
jgi:hypothetical protein